MTGFHSVIDRPLGQPGDAAHNDHQEDQCSDGQEPVGDGKGALRRLESCPATEEEEVCAGVSGRGKGPAVSTRSSENVVDVML